MGKENLEVMDMFFWHVTGYKDVIHVNKDEGEFLVNLIQKPLEDLCCIPEPKRHHEVFIEAKRCYNGSLWNVIFVHQNLVDGPDKINLSLGCEVWDIDQVW